MSDPILRISDADAWELRLRLYDLGDWYDGGRLDVRFPAQAMMATGLTPTQARKALEVFARCLDDALRESGKGEAVK